MVRALCDVFFRYLDTKMNVVKSLIETSAAVSSPEHIVWPCLTMYNIVRSRPNGFYTTFTFRDDEPLSEVV